MSFRRKIAKKAKLMNLYPPFIGAGIRVKHVNEAGTSIKVQMRLTWYNRNMHGTHFGGSLYAMSDPFYVFAAYNFFGDQYILWDKSASIEYVSPGKGTVQGIFEIPDHRLQEMKKEVDRLGKQTYTFGTDITDLNGKVVAKISKEIYIRKKRAN